jgi:hypothetical protein
MNEDANGWLCAITVILGFILIMLSMILSVLIIRLY